MGVAHLPGDLHDAFLTIQQRAQRFRYVIVEIQFEYGRWQADAKRMNQLALRQLMADRFTQIAEAVSLVRIQNMELLVRIR